MDHILSLGSDWVITSAGGATGEAYVAKSNNEKLFLKRNSSPFIAVLSAEGIVPKLVWTKRMENGDVVTAQQWLDGRILNSNDMIQPAVAKLLSKIHHSTELLDMLKRIHHNPIHPNHILNDIYNRALPSLEHPIVSQAYSFLEEELQNMDCSEKVVCHGDVNHNNWILSNEEQLYLIDWDGAMIADPALDIGLLLYCYVPKEQWKTWLDNYGTELTPSLEHRMKWYVIAQTILAMVWHESKKDMLQMERSINLLWGILYE